MENLDVMVLRTLREWRAQGLLALLATVVRTWGSSPRPVGSIMALNENTNGLVRQYLPKGTDLSSYSQEQLDAIADQINNRPRKGLGVRSPLAVYGELLLNSPQHSTLVH